MIVIPSQLKDSQPSLSNVLPESRSPSKYRPTTPIGDINCDSIHYVSIKTISSVFHEVTILTKV